MRRSLQGLGAILCLITAPCGIALGATKQDNWDEECGYTPGFSSGPFGSIDAGSEGDGGSLADGEAAMSSAGIAAIPFDDMPVEAQQWGLANAMYIIAMDAVMRGDEVTAAAASGLGQTYVDSLMASGITGDGVMDMAVAFEAYLDYGVMIIDQASVDLDSVEWYENGQTYVLTVDQAMEVLRRRAFVEPD